MIERISTISLGAVEYTDNGWTNLTGESSEEHRLAARHSLPFSMAKIIRVAVSRQSDTKSARTLTYLELSCLLYCRLNLVVHRSEVTRGRIKVNQDKSNIVQYVLSLMCSRCNNNGR